MIDYQAPASEEMLEVLARTYEAHPDITVGSIGKSVLGRGIPLFILGHGQKASLFVGAHHAAESITALILMRFIEDLIQKGRLFGYETRRTFSHRRLYIVPMLNPDGCAIQREGAAAAGILSEKVIRMNGSEDFSLWQANARGVDLNHNYDAQFQKCKEAEEKLGITQAGPTRYGGLFPESEPESAALAGLVRYLAGELSAVLALHTQGEEIYRDFMGHIPKGGRALSEMMARVSGYRISSPPPAASFGGFKDFVIKGFDIPAFTIECGKGKNPLPSSAFPAIYRRVLPMLLAAAAF